VRFGVTKSIANGFEDVLLTLACTVAKRIEPRGFSYTICRGRRRKSANEGQYGEQGAKARVAAKDARQAASHGVQHSCGYEQCVVEGMRMITYSLFVGVFQAVAFMIDPKPASPPALADRVALFVQPACIHDRSKGQIWIGHES